MLLLRPDLARQVKRDQPSTMYGNHVRIAGGHDEPQTEEEFHAAA
jgi:hypothetical protein